MDFGKRKLPKEAAQTMRICSMQSIQSFAPMPAPVYVFMRLNEKFVAIKSPLDFFTPPEIEKLRPMECVFFPEFIDVVEPFKQAGRTLRALLSWKPQVSLDALESETSKKVAMTPAPYELSDAVLRVVGPLWSLDSTQNATPEALPKTLPKILIEPFFISVFVNELCDLIPSGALTQARESSIAAYETAIMRSSLSVFLALHLGYCDLGFLNKLRLKAFEKSLSCKSENVLKAKGAESDEIIALSFVCLPDSGTKAINGEFFSHHPWTRSAKIASRLNRILKNFVDHSNTQPSIRGERGFSGV